MQNKSYKNAGVDIVAGYQAVELMKEHVARTQVAGVPSASEILGGFGGVFIPDLKGMTEPVLVSGTDGVGTKIKLTHLIKKYDTIGIDLVAMCANDIICCGAKPLFFLDYISHVNAPPENIAIIVKGIADGCVEAGCALIGGETAQHPGGNEKDGFDLAGFCVGIADKPKLIGKTARAGDVIIGLESSGVHSNGFSLVREVFGKKLKKGKDFDKALCKTLLTPTRLYVKPILDLIGKVKVKGIAHITGGGFYENIPRCLPDGLTAVIDKSAWEVPEIFERIAKKGKIPERDMFSTFNMGIGMAVVLSPAYKAPEKAIAALESSGVKASIIGKVVKGDELSIL